MRRKQVRLLLDAVLLGVIGAIVALLFSSMVDLSQEFFLGKIALYHPPEKDRLR